jgi:ParB family chromosome partitioning protein
MPKTIPLSAIDATGRLRPVDPDHAALIAASIEQKGLLQPIVVRPRGDKFALTAGAHRLRALADLGWKDLTVGQHVIVQERDEFDARIDEIDENLARHELNALDRAFFLAERKELYEEKNRTLGKGGDRKSAKFRDEINSASCTIGFSPRFSKDAAARTGLSEDVIKRAVRIAQALDMEAVEALRGTPVEKNQRELLALCELDAAEQRQVAEQIRDGAGNVYQALVKLGKANARKPGDEQVDYGTILRNAWANASKITRADFMRDFNLVYAPKGAGK